MKILNPLTDNMEPIQSVLRSLSGQDGCDGEPYDQMQSAAEYIDSLEDQIKTVTGGSELSLGNPDETKRDKLDGFIFYNLEKDHEDNFPLEIFLGTSDWVTATDGFDIFPAVFDHINHSWNRPNWTQSPLSNVFWQSDVNVIAWKPLTKLGKSYVIEACTKRMVVQIRKVTKDSETTDETS
jgi:hypothetical protein